MNEIEITRKLEAAVELLASIEHQRWAHWQEYMHRMGERVPDGRLILPADQVKRWDRQIAMTFEQLDEAEKESDRDQVRRYLPTVIAALVNP